MIHVNHPILRATARRRGFGSGRPLVAAAALSVLLPGAAFAQQQTGGGAPAPGQAVPGQSTGTPSVAGPVTATNGQLINPSTAGGNGGAVGGGSTSPGVPVLGSRNSLPLPGSENDRAPRTFTLAETIAAALQTSAAVQTGRRNVAISRNRTSEIAAQGRFNVSGAASATRFDRDTRIQINPDAPPIVTQRDHSEALSLNLTLPLDFLGQIRSATNQARLLGLVDEFALQQAQNDRVLAANRVYFNLLRAGHQVQVAAAALRSAQAQQAIAVRLWNGGVGQKLDFYRANTLVAQNQQALLRAQNNLALIRSDFNNLVGRPQDAVSEAADVPGVTVGVDVAAAAPKATGPVIAAPPAPGQVAAPPAPAAPVVPPPAAPPGPPSPPVGSPAPEVFTPFRVAPEELAAINLDQSVAAALRQRPELLAGEVNVRASDIGVRLARAGNEPTFALRASGNYYPTTSFQFPRQATAAITAQVNVPIFDNGLTRARVNEARLRTENVRTSLESARADVSLFVRQAFDNLQNAARQIEAANTALEQAVAARQLAQMRYENQVGLFLEVVDAQAALVRAENDQINAVYDYPVARAEFENAVGAPRLDSSPTSPSAPAPAAAPAPDAAAPTVPTAPAATAR